MGTMPILIPTSGRPKKQYTLSFIRHLAPRVHLVVQAAQESMYRLAHPDVPILVLPDHIRMISPTRQWIMEWARDNGHKYVCMADDDLRLFKRRAPTGDNSGAFSLLNATQEEITEMFDAIEDGLHRRGYAHVGISAREGNNHIERDEIEVGRMMRVLSYNVGVFFETGTRFDRIDTKQDFDVTLQLLRKGYPNLVFYTYGQGQATGSGAAGGCSVFRDHDMMSRCAEELAALHPGFIRIDDKETKTAFGGGVRKDVTVYWKKAYDSSRIA